MDLEQLTGRYRRLKEELAVAYGEQPWPAGRIDRLAQEIAEAERAIAALGTKARGSMPVAAPGQSRLAPRTPPVLRNRLTPFGQRVAEPAGE